MNLKTLLFILVLHLGTLSIEHEPYNIERTLTGKAIKIVDGDTFDLLVSTITYRIRLNGIDTPERGQDFYLKAKDALSNYCGNQILSIKYSSKDRKGRLIANVYTSTRTWINLN